MSAVNAAWRGDRRLRVTLELSERRVTVTGVSLLEGPAVQRPSLAGDIAIRVDVAGELALIDAVRDPRITRGSSRPEHPGHRYLQNSLGTLMVEVPFRENTPLSELAIRVADLTRVKTRSADPAVVAKSFDKKSTGMRKLPPLGLANLVSHPDWVRIAPTVGVAPETRAAFEIYLDRQHRYRWRLRRPDGLIVAESGEGYADRTSCERDLRWIRAFGLNAEIRSLDVVPPKEPGG